MLCNTCIVLRFEDEVFLFIQHATKQILVQPPNAGPEVLYLTFMFPDFSRDSCVFTSLSFLWLELSKSLFAAQIPANLRLNYGQQFIFSNINTRTDIFIMNYAAWGQAIEEIIVIAIPAALPLPVKGFSAMGTENFAF